MKNRILSFLKNNLIALAFGLVLFLGYSVFSFHNQIKLNSKILNINDEYQELEKLSKFRLTELEVNRTFLRTKLPEFYLNDFSNKIYSSGSIKKYKKGIILFVVGNCGVCFENEIPIWNEINQKVTPNNYFMLVVNTSKQIDLAKKYFNETSLQFPIVNANENFLDYNNKYPLAEIITFIVQPDLTIESIHVSMFQNIKHTKKFKENILQVIIEDQK
ncbi:MAG: hypothetical protein WA440_07490 [Ignavibacteriaceae bacterium]